MIDTCVNDNASTAHQKFAGRLFIGDLYHTLYGNEWNIPTVREQHEKLLAKGVVKDLHFSDKEWEENLGYFSTPEEAHEAWRKCKYDLAQLVAAKESDMHVVEALKNRYSIEEWYK